MQYVAELAESSEILRESIIGILGNKNVLTQLDRFRKRGDDINIKPPEQLLSIFTACLPIVRRAMPWRSRINQDEIANKDVRLWAILTQDFSWESYVSSDGTCDGSRATGALINYLGMAMKGDGQEAVEAIYYEEEAISLELASQETVNPEDLYIQKEELEFVRTIFCRWLERLTPLQREIVNKRYIDGISTKEASEELKTSESVVKQRLKAARRWLVVSAQEIITENDLEEGISIFKIAESEEMKKGGVRESHINRRNLILARLQMFGMLPPKTKQALLIFYGLGEDDPVFDITKTAEIMGITETNCRVLLSHGLRIITGREKLPRETIVEKDQRQFYDIWREDPAKFGLSGEQTRSLELHFGEGLSFEKIGEEMGISEETARRRVKSALKIIDDRQ